MIGNVIIYVSYVAGSFVCFFYEDYVIDGSHIFGVLHMMAQSYFVCFTLCAAHPGTPKTIRRHELLAFAFSLSSTRLSSRLRSHDHHSMAGGEKPPILRHSWLSGI